MRVVEKRNQAGLLLYLLPFRLSKRRQGTNVGLDCCQEQDAAVAQCKDPTPFLGVPDATSPAWTPLARSEDERLGQRLGNSFQFPLCEATPSTALGPTHSHRKMQACTE